MTTTALVPTAPDLQPAAVVISDTQRALIKRTLAENATDAELGLFFYDCTRRGVHPLDRLIHFTKRGGKYAPVTSIDFMRMRAAETNEYAGSDDAVFHGEPGDPHFAASVTVYRLVQGGRYPFSATARWSEYYVGETQGYMWRKMPHTMLAKCAEALALRKGFPQQLHGLYAAEELDQAIDFDVPDIPDERDEPPPHPVEAQAPQPPPQSKPKPRPVPPPQPPPVESESGPTPLRAIATTVILSVKPWPSKTTGETVWYVKFADGTEASTTKQAVADEAMAFERSKTPVVPALAPKTKGEGYFLNGFRK